MLCCHFMNNSVMKKDIIKKQKTALKIPFQTYRSKKLMLESRECFLVKYKAEKLERISVL